MNFWLHYFEDEREVVRLATPKENNWLASHNLKANVYSTDTGERVIHEHNGPPPDWMSDPLVRQMKLSEALTNETPIRL